jgi:hypothetical protein
MISQVYCRWCRKTVAANLGGTDKIVRGFEHETDILAKHKDGREGHAWVLVRKEVKTLQRVLAKQIS